MTRNTRLALGAIIAGGLFAAPVAQACCLFGGTSQTTYYAPMSVAPAPSPCNTCATPQTTFMPAIGAPVAAVPVTTYRPGLFGRRQPVVAMYAPVAPAVATAGYVPYSAGYVPYTAAYAPVATTAGYSPYVAGYSPLTSAYPASTTSIVSYMPYTSYRPTPLYSPAMAVPVSAYYPTTAVNAYPTGGCNTCSTPTTTYMSAPVQATYVQPAPAAPCCGNAPIAGSAPMTSAPLVSNQFSPPAGAPMVGNGGTINTFAPTFTGTQTVTGNAPTPAPTETRRIIVPDVPTAAPLMQPPQPITDPEKFDVKPSQTSSPLSPGRELNPENKTALVPLVDRSQLAAQATDGVAPGLQPLVDTSTSGGTMRMTALPR